MSDLSRQDRAAVRELVSRAVRIVRAKDGFARIPCICGGSHYRGAYGIRADGRFPARPELHRPRTRGPELDHLERAR